MESLLSKYRPSTLSEVLGQSEVVRSLQLYVKAPYPTAMLLHGESGVGKGATTFALARDLGIAVDEAELGGFTELASGNQTADSVREACNNLRMGALFGSGRRMLVVNECERVSLQAETIWLDALEHIPPKALIVFTTNAPERLSKRFRDRCECYAFVSDPDVLSPHFKALAKRIWKAEGCPGKVPTLEKIGMPTLSMDGPDALHASFRLALQQLSRLIREALHGDVARLGKVQRQVAKDLLVLDTFVTANCDHCGEENKVRKGGDKHECESCGKTFLLEW